MEKSKGIKRFTFKICSKRLGYVFMAGSVLALQNFFSAYGSMGLRKNSFNDEFMEENFKDLHKTYFGLDSPVPKMGYPDLGAGWYAKTLAYKNWYEFNNAQRVHNNSIEHMPAIMPLILIGGLFRPRFTLAMASVIFVGRGLYTAGYMSP